MHAARRRARTARRRPRAREQRRRLGLTDGPIEATIEVLTTASTLAPAGHGGALRLHGGAAAHRARRAVRVPQGAARRGSARAALAAAGLAEAPPAEAKASPAEAEVFVMPLVEAQWRGGGGGAARGRATAGRRRRQRRYRWRRRASCSTRALTAASSRAHAEVAPPARPCAAARAHFTTRAQAAPPWQPFEGGGVPFGHRGGGDNRPLAPASHPVSIVDASGAHPRRPRRRRVLHRAGAGVVAGRGGARGEAACTPREARERARGAAGAPQLAQEPAAVARPRRDEARWGVGDAGVAAASSLGRAARCRLDAAAGVDADAGRARADSFKLAVKENAPRTSPVEADAGAGGGVAGGAAGGGRGGGAAAACGGGALAAVGGKLRADGEGSRAARRAEADRRRAGRAPPTRP